MVLNMAISEVSTPAKLTLKKIATARIINLV